MFSIESRLAKLEKSNRRWRWLAVAAAACLSVRLLMGAAPPGSFSTISVTRIQVVDPQGHEVGVLTGEGGFGSLSLTSGSDASHVVLCAAIPKTNAGPVVDLANSGGHSVVSLSRNDDGSGFVGVYSAEGKRRIAMRAHVQTGPPTTAPASAGIYLSDEKGDPRAIFAADDEAATLILYTHNGKGASVAAQASDVGQSGIMVKQAGGGAETRWP